MGSTPLTQKTYDDDSLTTLLELAGRGDRGAWNELVARFAPLVWSVCQRMGLTRPDAEDVCQGVWVRLVEHLDRIREPAALPGWLATTTRHECVRVMRGDRQRKLRENRASRERELTTTGADLDKEILAAEQRQALRAAFAELAPACRRLLELLLHDPPLAYAEIGDKIGRPVGSIGPSRARCLERLRRHPALRAFAGPAREGMERGTDDG